MGRLISLIYFFLISALGLIFLVIGLYNSVSLVVNLTQYDKYPTMYPGSDNCVSITTTVASPPAGVPISPYPMNNDNERKLCEQRVNDERKQHKVDDTKNSIYFTLIGIILLAIHLPIAIKKSSEEKREKKN